jgi:preprotein translocase subunit SecA
MIFTKIFDSKNDKIVKKYLKRVKKINELEAKYKAMSDEELQSAFNTIRDEVKAGTKSLDEVLNDSFAITRETSTRVLGLRHYDVQLVGGMVLHENSIAEMKTGEGKTLVATSAVILNAMSGDGVHVVTVNDYLASRDSKEMGQLYNFLGFSVGCLTDGIPNDNSRKEQYDCDITYGTNNEYAFDYLRDNMKTNANEKVQRKHHYAIVDEVDSILIDEARTPLIISGPVKRSMEFYDRANAVALQMIQGEKRPTKVGEPEDVTGDFIVDEKNRTIAMTEAGLDKAQELFGVGNMYSLENASLAHHLDQALKANYLFKIDIDYVVQNGEIIIVDEFTGRLSTGRRYSEGLHQALESKEGVAIKEESQTLADITYQNYFRLYSKLAGMTGTAQTEATEFSQIYNLDVISIPTNVPVARKDFNDLIYNTEREKFNAVVAKVKELHAKGQPVLIGTASIEKSESIHALLLEHKMVHNVLNAKNHAQEAEIILDAGRKGAITVATNMAGRGVDIKINDEVKSLGGLFILGTERHESRRIDNQLRGRSGRQGDTGASQFYLSLDDNLLRIFGGDKIKSIMNRLGIEEGEFIDSKIVTSSVEKAQKRVESMHYESRKHILEYDDIANEQRKVIYNFRNQLLDESFDIDDRIKDNRAEYIENLLSECDIYDGDSKNDFNLSKLIGIILESLHIELEADVFDGLEFNQLKEKLALILDDVYAQKFAPLSDKQKSEVQRILYLQVLDQQWREHLYEMDVLKTGIGLRGYNQKDPLTEYKKDSYNLFMQLIDRIKKEAMEILYIVRFNMTAPQEQSKEEMNALLEEMEASMNAMSVDNVVEADIDGEDEVQEPIGVEKKPKRNELCSCGSGKKYKDCCGKSGPKKGILA